MLKEIDHFFMKQWRWKYKPAHQKNSVSCSVWLLSLVIPDICLSYVGFTISMQTCMDRLAQGIHIHTVSLLHTNLDRPIMHVHSESTSFQPPQLALTTPHSPRESVFHPCHIVYCFHPSWWIYTIIALPSNAVLSTETYIPMLRCVETKGAVWRLNDLCMDEINSVAIIIIEL